MLGGFGRQSRSFGKSRLIIAVIFIAFSFISYLGSKEYNPVTGEDQYISITPKQEIALGLRATPQMIQQYGGLYPDQKYQNLVEKVGHKVVTYSQAGKTQYKFDFHLLNDSRTINAFALPGGQVFITSALLSKLKTEGQLAGVLGHEIGHVVARHSAQQMAKSNLTNGILNGILIASDPTGQSAQIAAYIGKLVNMKFGRNDELQADNLGVKFMSQTGYDPRSMIGVMKILKQAAGGGAKQPEFFSTHPNPDNRIAEIQKAIRAIYPNGVPSNRVK